MRVEEAFSLLGLSNGVHKPLELDRAFFKPSKNGPSDEGNSPEATEASNADTPFEIDGLSILDRIGIWDSLVFGWTYLSKSEVKKRKPKKLCAIRKQRLLADRAADFAAAIAADFPNRILYPWDIEVLFGSVDDLCAKEHGDAAMNGEVVSDSVIRCRIARARFQALYLDPTLIWIKGTYLESKSGKTVSRRDMDWMTRYDIGDRDYMSWDFLPQEECENLYRLRYPSSVERCLFRISRMYGNCGKWLSTSGIVRLPELQTA